MTGPTGSESAHRVLVTGANGFVGRHLCRVLQSHGFLVRGAARRALAACDVPAGVESVVIGDVDGTTDWSEALNEVHSVVHLVARVHNLRESRHGDNGAYKRVTVDGTANLITAAKTRVKRFVYLSSIKAMGEITGIETQFSEKDPCSPSDPYGMSKRDAELIVNSVKDEVEVVILRPPLIYGPGVRGNFYRLMRLVDSGIPLPLGAIQNMRSLIYVENLADAIACALTHSTVAGKTFLIADPEPLSTPQMVQLIAEMMGRPNRLVRFPRGLVASMLELIAPADARRTLGSLTIDTSLFCQTTGWSSPIPTTEAFRRTVHWFQQRNALSTPSN